MSKSMEGRKAGSPVTGRASGAKSKIGKAGRCHSLPRNSSPLSGLEFRGKLWQFLSDNQRLPAMACQTLMSNSKALAKTALREAASRKRTRYLLALSEAKTVF